MIRPVTPSENALVADAVFVNPHCNAGAGATRWRSFLTSEPARQAGLAHCATLAHPERLDGEVLEPVVHAWVVNRLLAGARRFVAAGGDGTVHTLLNALRVALPTTGVRLEDLTLGAVGLGSSNDLHKPLRAEGVPHRLDFAAARPMDVGELHLDDAPPVWFLAAASLGLTADGNERVHRSRGLLRTLKRRWVDAAFVVAGLRVLAHFDPLRGEVLADGEPFARGRMASLAVVKTPWLGGDMRFDLATLPDDGHFGLHLCGDVGRREVLVALAALHGGQFSECSGTASQPANLVDIRLDRARTVEVDGESRTARHVVARVLPKAVRMCP
ncbi:MAG: hypothetical protein EP330_15760 [Deltaproteobacteria bacterium]|nr:MAG: hypothetical protein EP330_15760 [Deltaproteobacteria bacterium]